MAMARQGLPGDTATPRTRRSRTEGCAGGSGAVIRCSEPGQGHQHTSTTRDPNPSSRSWAGEKTDTRGMKP